MIKAVVFDFDGVIVRLSELVKEGAWGFLAQHPDIGDRVVVAEALEHFARARGTRFDILEMVFKKLGKKIDQIPKLIQEHAERFGTIVEDGIRALGVTDIDKTAITQLSKRYPLYINTGTPEVSAQAIVKGLAIDAYFKGIYGMPLGKLDNLRRVVSLQNVKADQIIFVGDSEWDWEAAKKFGCHFIGVANPWNAWQGNHKPFPLVTSLSELQDMIVKL